MFSLVYLELKSINLFRREKYFSVKVYRNRRKLFTHTVLFCRMSFECLVYLIILYQPLISKELEQSIHERQTSTMGLFSVILSRYMPRAREREEQCIYSNTVLSRMVRKLSPSNQNLQKTSHDRYFVTYISYKNIYFKKVA